MKSKHTPGPWMWHLRSPQSGYELVHPNRGYLLVMDFTRLGMGGGQPRFATWKGEDRGYMGGIMRKAAELRSLDDHPDAKLIAAAPELLAACKLAKQHLQPELTEPGRTVFWKLVDAIAAAEGTTP